MKKVIQTYLVVVLILLSFHYVFAGQDKAVSNNSVEMINITAELIKCDNDYRPSKWEGDTHEIYKSNFVSFRIIKPDKYIGKEITVEGFGGAEFDSYWRFESKKGAYYSFDIPNDFFSGGHNRIYRALVRNLKEIPK